jgi:hypothetical protein
MSVSPLRFLSRPTGGVKLVALDAGTTVVAVAHNAEAAADAVTAQAADGGSDGLADQVLTQDGAPMSQTSPVDGAGDGVVMAGDGTDDGPDTDPSEGNDPASDGTDEGGSA